MSGARRARRAWLLATFAAVSASCVSLTWSREIAEKKILPAELERLPPDADLADCLALLGAPLFVWEDARGSVALAYGWSRSRGLGVRASVPVTDAASASFQYSDGLGDARGLVLFFDDSWRLQRSRFGYLRDLSPVPAPFVVDPESGD